VAAPQKPAAEPGPAKAAAPAKPKEIVADEIREAPRATITGAKEVWEAVLKDLLASGKRSVHACISQGQLVGLTDTQATLQFASAFAKERSEKEDYRNIIEKILAQLTGRQVKISCVLGAAAPPVKESAPAPAAPVKNEEHPALNQALMMFGGKVIKEEK
jgi:DNA polymerase-3 subunit gamma/tau